MKWMHTYTNDFDSRSFNPKWYTQDFTYVASDGTVTQGMPAALDAVKALYAPLTAQYHEPYFLMCSETDYGYEMIGQAKLYCNLAGQRSAGEKPPVKDQSTGREWDLAVPGGFRFEYVKDDSKEGGFVLRKTEIMSDGSQIGLGLVKRGVIQPKDLGF